MLLVLSKIADEEGLEISEQEIDAEIARARARYTDNPRLVGYFESARGRSYLRSTMRRTQIVERLVDRWLEAHPEVGPLAHLEEDAGVAAFPEGGAPEVEVEPAGAAAGTVKEGQA